MGSDLSMSPELLESVQHSPLTPWVAGVAFLFLAFAFLKLIAKTLGKLFLLALLATAAVLGWNWWGEPSRDTFSGVREDWFASVQSSDFSSHSIEALAKDTSRLLTETAAISQAKGREAAKDALAKMAETLKEKMQQASARGETEAKEHIERLHNEVMTRLR